MTDITWSETGKLIVGVLGRSHSDREQFIRDRCSDPGLADNIRALFTTRALDPPVSSARSVDVETASTVHVGQQVGPYIVMARLGRGGMGEVFLANDTRLDRPVALKCLLPSGAAQGDLRESVIREARAAARLTHANVAAIHDVVEHHGRAFIVMEYVEGEALASLIRRGPLPAVRVLQIARQLAGALLAAHGAGIVHRDLKPANVQVTRDGGVKVLDFGIATALESLASATTRTGRGAVVDVPGAQPGTPAYMSPEQLLGRPADERSDLFSLAVIMFEMATGRRPVASSQPLDLLVAAIQTLPRADNIGEDVPPVLADVIEKGLVADPLERFQSAAEMLAAMQAAETLIDAPVVDSDPAPQSIVRRILWIVGIAASLPVVFWVLGRLTSEAYNNTMERTGAFAWDPALAQLDLGRRSIVAPAVYATLAAAALWVARFVVRVVELSDDAHRRLRGGAVRLRTIARRLSLHDPVVLSQGLSALGLLSLGGVLWRFNALVHAWSSSINTADPGAQWPLSPENEPEKVLYRAVLTVLFLLFSAGLLRVLHLRQRLRSHGHFGVLTALVAIVSCFFLLIEVPYRIMWKSKAPRVMYAGQRCYAIGEAGPRQLLYCPDSPPPRNREVDASDPALRPTGVVEEIFSPSIPAR